VTTARLRLGVLGMSPGNGHPYSWSAIINGYDAEVMATCPYPAIPEYLARQQFPQAALTGADVTHVWTQDRQVSEHIARASLIPTVVEQPDAMIGQVDAVLLARDDAENHLGLAQVFLRAGLPVYIDKPLGLSRRAAERLFELTSYPSQIFTCTALRYARELRMTKARRERVGPVKLVDATVPKEWQTYAVHVIEPVLATFPEADTIVRHQCIRDAGMTQLWVSWASGVQGRFISTGKAAAPIAISVYGERAAVRLTFHDAFSAFKAALADFLTSVRERRSMIARDETLRVVDLIEMGCC
jgi:hypothetical protein